MNYKTIASPANIHRPWHVPCTIPFPTQKRYSKKEDPTLILAPSFPLVTEIVTEITCNSIWSSDSTSWVPHLGLQQQSSSRGSSQTPPSDLVHYHHSFRRHAASFSATQTGGKDSSSGERNVTAAPLLAYVWVGDTPTSHE